MVVVVVVVVVGGGGDGGGGSLARHPVPTLPESTLNGLVLDNSLLW